MTTLELIPRSWFSWDFDILKSGSTVAGIEMPWLRYGGVLNVGGCNYGVYREGGFMKLSTFVLASNSTQLARAENRSLRSRWFTVEHEGKTYILKGQSWLGRSVILVENGQEIGSIVPRGWNTRKAVVKLPDSLPTPVQIFLIWLALIMWKRDGDGA
jgi:hypothetical protein